MAYKICLDAGHYGKYNRSKVVPEYYESEMNWKLHNYLAEELEQLGFAVIKTRENQEKDLGLTARVLSQTPAVAVFPSSGSASRTLWGLRRGKAICLLKFIPETVYYPSWPKYFKQLSALISSLAKNIFKKKSIMRFSPQR